VCRGQLDLKEAVCLSEAMWQSGVKRFFSSRILVASPHEIKKLYRTILKLAFVYPSIKRQSIIMEIKHDFRINKNETDPIKLSDSIKKAVYGISHLQKYTNLDPKSTEWVIDLEKEPLPAPKKK
jgi:hypothetical protein